MGHVGKRSLCLFMPNGGVDGVIQVWQPGELKWVEFRGPPYSKWGDTHSPMQQIHDELEGMHATVLHQGSVLHIDEDRHKPSFNFIWTMYKNVGYANG